MRAKARGQHHAGSVRRVTTHGVPTDEVRRRTVWFLAAFGVILVAVIIGGMLRERVAPAAGSSPGGRAGQAAPGWITASGIPGARASDLAASGVHRYAFPVVGPVNYERTHHDYPATDIIAACGSRVVAVTNGVVLEVNRVDAYDATADDGASRGGLHVSILGDDGVRYYGSHFRSIVARLVAGTRVGVGEVIGSVGESGNSTCHLHFGISPPCDREGDWWIRRGVIWPASYLDSWRQGGAASPVAEVVAWHAAHGCPRA
jgi:peptidoglycan LD-endopeptidase LytH